MSLEWWAYGAWETFQVEMSRRNTGTLTGCGDQWRGLTRCVNWTVTDIYVATEARGITITIYGGFCWSKKTEKEWAGGKLGERASKRPNRKECFKMKRTCHVRQMLWKRQVKECKALIRFSISASPTVAYLVTIIFYFKYLSHKIVNMHIKRRTSFPSLYIQYLV